MSNSPSFEDAAALEFFETSTRNLLAAEAAAGVGHHVALSVVGTGRLQHSGYFRRRAYMPARGSGRSTRPALRGRHSPNSRMEVRKDEHPDRRQCLPARPRAHRQDRVLTLAETSQPWEEAVCAPIEEWLSDPADDQRYEVALRSLLGAVEALEARNP